MKKLQRYFLCYEYIVGEVYNLKKELICMELGFI